MSLEGLIFDCDGTLIDSMPYHWLAWQHVTTRYGIEFAEDRFYALGGVPTRHILTLLKEEQGLDYDPIAVAHEKEQAYLPYLEQVPLLSATVDIVRANHGKLPMGVATGGTRRIIEQVLRRLEVLDLFGAVVTSEDVVHQKPAPDIFLEAAARLGVNPAGCRAYEDTDLGLEAIRAAGMQAIDVRTWVTTPSSQRASA